MFCQTFCSARSLASMSGVPFAAYRISCVARSRRSRCFVRLVLRQTSSSRMGRSHALVRASALQMACSRRVTYPLVTGAQSAIVLRLRPIMSNFPLLPAAQVFEFSYMVYFNRYILCTAPLDIDSLSAALSGYCVRSFQTLLQSHRDCRIPLWYRGETRCFRTAPFQPGRFSSDTPQQNLSLDGTSESSGSVVPA